MHTHTQPCRHAYIHVYVQIYVTSCLSSLVTTHKHPNENASHPHVDAYKLVRHPLLPTYMDIHTYTKHIESVIHASRHTLTRANNIPLCLHSCRHKNTHIPDQGPWSLGGIALKTAWNKVVSRKIELSTRSDCPRFLWTLSNVSPN